MALHSFLIFIISKLPTPYEKARGLVPVAFSIVLNFQQSFCYTGYHLKLENAIQSTSRIHIPYNSVVCYTTKIIMFLYFSVTSTYTQLTSCAVSFANNTIFYLHTVNSRFFYDNLPEICFFSFFFLNFPSMQYYQLILLIRLCLPIINPGRFSKSFRIISQYRLNKSSVQSFPCIHLTLSLSV